MTGQTRQKHKQNSRLYHLPVLVLFVPPQCCGVCLSPLPYLECLYLLWRNKTQLPSSPFPHTHTTESVVCIWLLCECNKGMEEKRRLRLNLINNENNLCSNLCGILQSFRRQWCYPYVVIAGHADLPACQLTANTHHENVMHANTHMNEFM